jgi:hypothetical protein
MPLADGVDKGLISSVSLTESDKHESTMTHADRISILRAKIAKERDALSRKGPR